MKRIDFGRILDPDCPYERCGYVDTDGHVIEVPNLSFDPANKYRLSGIHVVEGLSSTQSDLYAHWHTHPPGSGSEPSDLDLEGLPERMLGIVVHVSSGKQTRYVRGRKLRPTERF